MKAAIGRVMLSLLLALVLLSNATAAFAMEKQDTDAQGQYTVKDSRHYPIIFIPGMAGSTLDIGGGGNAWPGSLSTNDEAFKVLALKKDGKSPLYGTRVIATDTIKYGLGDVYPVEGPALTAALKAALGAVPLIGGLASLVTVTEDLRFFPIYQGFYDYMEEQGYKLNENPTGKVFFDFPYDFRQDNRNWTKLLDKKVDEVRQKTGSDKVILVGHSMGGIQARLYMKEPKRAAKVAAVVFMGTPHQGSPMAFFSFTEGYNFGNQKLTDARMWEIAGNWAGGYQLLPDYPFILDGDDLSKPPVGIEAMLHDNWICAQEYARYLEAQAEDEKYKVNKAFPNDDFAEESLEFHDKLGKSVDKYPGVKYFMIRGTNQPTVEYLVARYVTVPGLPEALIRFEKQYSSSNQGDGTVPLQGALVDGLDGLYEVASEHGAIPSNNEAQAILTGIRQEINNEEYRQNLVDKVNAIAGRKLAEFSSGGFSGEYESIWGMLWAFIGQPDKEKQELKKEIRNMALSVIRNCRVNITINAGEDEQDKDPVENIYLVIDNFRIKDAGSGIVSGANVNVLVDSYRTYESVLGNAYDASVLVNAYKSGAIVVKGKGLTNMLIAKLLEWYRKYM